eukprot:10601238-Alexandrium_andersonii.AAC.1
MQHCDKRLSRLTPRTTSARQERAIAHNVSQTSRGSFPGPPTRVPRAGGDRNVTVCGATRGAHSSHGCQPVHIDAVVGHGGVG